MHTYIYILHGACNMLMLVYNIFNKFYLKVLKTIVCYFCHHFVIPTLRTYKQLNKRKQIFFSILELFNHLRIVYLVY